VVRVTDGAQEKERRAGDPDPLVLQVFLRGHRCSIDQPSGTIVGIGYKPFLNEDRTVELVEDDRAPVLPGVFYSQVIGADFHDDVIRLPHFGAGKRVEIRHDPMNATDRSALAVFGGGQRVGYLPGAIAEVLAPPGTRAGRGIIMMEWSTDGSRSGISVLGSLQVELAVSMEE
jgi:hypothetical protein